MNRIVIELSDRDRSLLEGLMGSVSLLASVLGSSLPGPSRAAIIDKAVEDSVAALAGEHPADAPITHFEPPAPAPDPVAAAPAPAPVPLGEFQKALVTRCAESADVKQKVQALVHKYAESVSAIPEDKRPEVLAALAQI
jgi:hypothetical protein